VEKGNPMALLDGMRNALKLYNEKPEIIERMQEKGRTRCETVFQWNVSSRKYFEIYEKLLHAPSARCFE
jgi:glycogen synthase